MGLKKLKYVVIFFLVIIYFFTYKRLKALQNLKKKQNNFNQMDHNITNDINNNNDYQTLDNKKNNH